MVKEWEASLDAEKQQAEMGNLRVATRKGSACAHMENFGGRAHNGGGEGEDTIAGRFKSRQAAWLAQMLVTLRFTPQSW